MDIQYAASWDGVKGALDASVKGALGCSIPKSVAMHEVLLRCPIMADLVARHVPPCFEPQQPFPALVDAIVSQQISGKAAASIMGRLRELVPTRPARSAEADPRTHR